MQLVRKLKIEKQWSRNSTSVCLICLGFYKYSEDNRKSFHAGDYCEYDSEMLHKIISLLQYSLPGSKVWLYQSIIV